MYGTAGFARPAGFLLLGPTAVCLAIQPNRLPVPANQPNRLPVLSVQPNRLAVPANQPNRLDTGARG